VGRGGGGICWVTHMRACMRGPRVTPHCGIAVGRPGSEGARMMGGAGWSVWTVGEVLGGRSRSGCESRQMVCSAAVQGMRGGRDEDFFKEAGKWFCALWGGLRVCSRFPPPTQVCRLCRACVMSHVGLVARTCYQQLRLCAGRLTALQRGWMGERPRAEWRAGGAGAVEGKFEHVDTLGGVSALLPVWVRRRLLLAALGHVP